MSSPNLDRSSGVKFLYVLGTASSGILSGGLLSLSYMHVPAYLKNSSDASLLSQWQTMGAIGKAVVPPLTLIATGANFLNAYVAHTQSQRYRFLAAGMLSLAILPYTAIALAATNAEFAARAERRANDSMRGMSNLNLKQLITRWSNRSAIRGFLMLVSTAVSYDAMLHLSF